ncbi:GNAT family N-acetyltransferase [Rudaea sp.]|uniref:GNAT family N-acetyltransferase n=1 Tax=Rudaea sp. TaxID=2136325 RepID=UPI002ED31C3B
MRVAEAGGDSMAKASASADIRPLRPEDLPALIEMCAEHAAYERATFDPVGKVSRLAAALFSSVPRAHAWIAWDADRAIGYATASREFSTWSACDHLHLDCLFLRSSERGRGIGAMLLRTVVAAARAQDLCELQWQTPDWNAPAIAFYRRFGAAGKAKMRFTLSLDAG